MLWDKALVRYVEATTLADWTLKYDVFETFNIFW